MIGLLKKMLLNNPTIQKIYVMNLYGSHQRENIASNQKLATHCGVYVVIINKDIKSMVLSGLTKA